MNAFYAIEYRGKLLALEGPESNAAAVYDLSDSGEAPWLTQAYRNANITQSGAGNGSLAAPRNNYVHGSRVVRVYLSDVDVVDTVDTVNT